MSDLPPTADETARANKLISVLCDRQISFEQRAELDDLVVRFPQIGRTYVELVSLHSDLRQQRVLLITQDPTDSSAINAIVDRLGSRKNGSVANGSGAKGSGAKSSGAKGSVPRASASPASKLDLNEACILPAIGDEDVHGLSKPPEQQTGIFSPTTAVPPLLEKRLPWRSVAAVLLPLLTLSVIWAFHTRPGPKSDALQNSSPKFDPVLSPQCTVNVAINAKWSDAKWSDAKWSDAKWSDAKWSDADDSAPIVGRELTPGTHSLTSGMIKLELIDSAMLVIESPAKFEVVSNKELKLVQGKVCAQLTKVGGLTVVTPDLTAVDLGTEFGLDVVPGKQTHLEVLQGQVRVTASSSNVTGMSQNVIAGEAVTVSSGSTAIESDTPRPLSFLRPSQIQAADETSYQRWSRYSQVIRQDPDLSAYYPFDNEASDTNRLENRATHTLGKYTGNAGTPGVAGSHPVWTNGRWPGKAALQFGGAELTALTLDAQPALITDNGFAICCWLKRSDLNVPGAKDGSQAINLGLIPKGSTSAVKWIHFNWAKPNGAVAQNTPTDPWEFLVLTSTAAKGTLLYLNGKLVSSSKSLSSAADARQLVIGAPIATNNMSNLTEYFNGLMDELMIYRRALSDQEIEHLFQMGSP